MGIVCMVTDTMRCVHVQNTNVPPSQHLGQPKYTIRGQTGTCTHNSLRRCGNLLQLATPPTKTKSFRRYPLSRLPHSCLGLLITTFLCIILLRTRASLCFPPYPRTASWYMCETHVLFPASTCPPFWASLASRSMFECQVLPLPQLRHVDHCPPPQFFFKLAMAINWSTASACDGQHQVRNVGP